MTRDKLLTVNKWNKRKFGIGGSTINASVVGNQLAANGYNGLIGGVSAPPAFGIGNGSYNFSAPNNNWNWANWSRAAGNVGSSGLTIKPTTSFTDQFNSWNEQNKFSSSDALRDLGQNNDWRQAAGGKSKSNFDFKSTAQAAAGAILNTPAGDKLLDTFDPMWHIAGGRESEVGNAFSDTGKSLFKAGATTGNGWLMLAGAGAKVVGGGINTLIGTKWNKANIARIDKNIADMRNAAADVGRAKTIGELLDSWGNASTGFGFNENYIGKDGVFTDKVGKEWKFLTNQSNAAQDFLVNSFQKGAGNVKKRTTRNIMGDFSSSTSAAYGGPLDVIGNDNNMGAIGYGFMSDYMNMKNNQVQGKGNVGATYFSPMTFADGGSIYIDPKNKGKFTETMRRTGKSAEELSHSSNPLTRKRAIFALNARKWNHKHDEGGELSGFGEPIGLFALGGDMQTNGADWGTGLTHIDAGGTHEESPYEGVQYGIASDGEPNLVEEGETVFNDYVFSNRIKPKKSVLRQFHMYSRGGKLTYADVSKKLEKEAKERPNDPKSQAALKNMLSKLAEAQEQQKAEEEARKARKAFEALSPEEQAAVMQQLAQQQAAQQEGAEQQETPQEEVPVDENGNPIEQPQEEVPTEGMEGQPQEALMGAYGGKLGHRFDKGGWKKSLYNALGLHTTSEWNRFIKDAELSDFDISKYDDNATGYAKLLQDLQQNKDIDKWNAAIGKKSAALADALSRGYDFGTYTPNVNGYNLTDYAKTLKDYIKSKTKGNTSGNYAIDNDFDIGDYKTIKDYENSEAYKNYTNALVDLVNAAQGQKFKLNNGVLENIDGQNFSNLSLLNTLYNTALGTSTYDKGEPVPLFVDNGDGTYSVAKNAKELLVGTDGKSGLRYDGKGGIFHLNPALNTRNSVVVNRIMNDDGTIEDILGDVPKEYGKAVNSYSWDTKDANNTVNYFKRPVKEAPEEEEKEKMAKLKYTKNPYKDLGFMVPLMGLGFHMAGVGKPEYSDLSASLDYLNNGNFLADYKPIGGYQRYTSYDSQNAINRANATSLGAQRALANSNVPIGTRAALIIANAKNMQNNQGELGIKGNEYNDTNRLRVATFNNSIDKANADAYNRMSLANAQQRQQLAQLKATAALDIAKTRLAGDAEWNNGLYQGLTSLRSTLDKRAKETDMFNMARAYINSGAAGAATPELAMMLNTKTVAAKGGNLKKKGKRGLTF